MYIIGSISCIEPWVKRQISSSSYSSGMTRTIPKHHLLWACCQVALIWGFPKIGLPPNHHPFRTMGFSIEINHPFMELWGYPPFMEPPIWDFHSKHVQNRTPELRRRMPEDSPRGQPLRWAVADQHADWCASMARICTNRDGCTIMEVSLIQKECDQENIPGRKTRSDILNRKPMDFTTAHLDSCSCQHFGTQTISKTIGLHNNWKNIVWIIVEVLHHRKPNPSSSTKYYQTSNGSQPKYHKT